MRNFATEEHFDELEKFMNAICLPDNHRVLVEVRDVDPFDERERVPREYNTKLLHEILSQLITDARNGKFSEKRAKRSIESNAKLRAEIEEIKCRNKELLTEMDRLKTVTLRMDRLKEYRDSTFKEE